MLSISLHNYDKTFCDDNEYSYCIPEGHRNSLLLNSRAQEEECLGNLDLATVAAGYVEPNKSEQQIFYRYIYLTFILQSNL